MPGVNPLAAALMGGRFEGGGVSGSWAPDPTLEERWNKTATKGLIDALMSAATLPGRSDGKRRDASNYVVFDDKLISILRKYGMGGMVGTAAGYEMAQQLMQQEGEQQPPVRGINPTQPTNSRLVPLLMQQLPQTAPWSPNAT